MIGTIEKAEGLLDGTFRISLLTRQKPDLQPLMDKAVEITIKEKKARRGLDANSYYWVLLGHLAETIHMSKSRLHNILLRRYGQLEIVDDSAVYIVVPETEEAQNMVEEEEFFHLKPTDEVKVGKAGKTYRTYMLLRGSHSYDTREMSCLIDGLVSECRDVGIETATPEELQRMKEIYGIRYDKKNKSTAV